jgi:DNA-binding protein Fis
MSDSEKFPYLITLETFCLRQVERKIIEHVLKQVDGNHTKAAKLLGIGRATLYRKLKNYETLDARR